MVSAPYSPPLLANKAGYLIFAGNPNEALQTVEQALAIDPNCALAYLHKAHAQAALGNAAKAKDTLRTGLSAVTDDCRLQKLLANILIINKEYEEGLASIEKVLLLDQSDAEIWSLKGAASAYLNRKEDAISAFETAMKLDPKEKAYRKNRDAVRKG